MQFSFYFALSISLWRISRDRSCHFERQWREAMNKAIAVNFFWKQKWACWEMARESDSNQVWPLSYEHAPFSFYPIHLFAIQNRKGLHAWPSLARLKMDDAKQKLQRDLRLFHRRDSELDGICKISTVVGSYSENMVDQVIIYFTLM